MVMGNWKMNGRQSDIKQLLEELRANIPNEGAECVVFPPSVYIPLVSDQLQQSHIRWGAQNTYPKDNGAFTGEISALMLKDFGVTFALVGHSERRQIFKEDEKFVSEKFHHVKEHDIIPVLCVGETLQEREDGLTEQVLLGQLQAISDSSDNAFQQCVIAYEPVWAIGTGKTATPEQAQEIHAFIRSYIAEQSKETAEQISIVYGGSVNENNAELLFSMPDIDGGLVGGASLNARQFVEIVKCIN